MILTADLRVFELLASRLCHDVVGPIGAVNNGMELLAEDDEEMAGDAIELAGASARQAADALQFYRLAYGMAGTQVDANGPELARVAGAFLEKHKTRLIWPDGNMPIMAPDGLAKLLLNLVALAAESLPRGGEVSLDFAEGTGELTATAMARGQNSALRPEVAEALSMDCDIDDLSPRSIQGYFTALLAKRGGGSLVAARSGEEGFDFTVTLANDQPS